MSKWCETHSEQVDFVGYVWGIVVAVLACTVGGGKTHVGESVHDGADGANDVELYDTAPENPLFAERGRGV